MVSTRYRKLFSVFLIVPTVLVLVACTDQGILLKRLSDDEIILAFGDSLTFGTGAESSESYPMQLELLTGKRVVNAGKPGEISTEGLKRLPGLLDIKKPALVVLCHGGNDYLRRYDAALTESNLRSMIAQIKERDIGIVLIGVPKLGFRLETAKFYESIADDFKIPIESRILSAVLSNNDLKSDQIHPNADGYRKVAEAIQMLLRQTGAI